MLQTYFLIIEWIIPRLDGYHVKKSVEHILYLLKHTPKNFLST